MSNVDVMKMMYVLGKLDGSSGTYPTINLTDIEPNWSGYRVTRVHYDSVDNKKILNDVYRLKYDGQFGCTSGSDIVEICAAFGPEATSKILLYSMTEHQILREFK